MNSDRVVETLLQQAALGNPLTYARTANLVQDEELQQLAENLSRQTDTVLREVDARCSSFSRIVKDMGGRGPFSRKKKSANPLEEAGLIISDPGGPPSSVGVALHTANEALHLLQLLREGTRLINSASILSLTEITSKVAQDAEGANLGEGFIKELLGKIGENTSSVLQQVAMEQQINQGATTAFMSGVRLLGEAAMRWGSYCSGQAAAHEEYWRAISDRHQKEGQPLVIFEGGPHAVASDLALVIWSSIDKEGEIEAGARKDEVSLRTIYRVRSLMEAASRRATRDVFLRPGEQALDMARNLHPLVVAALAIFMKVATTLGEDTYKFARLNLDEDLRQLTQSLEFMDMSSIREKPASVMMTRAESFARSHLKEALQRVAECIRDGYSIEQASETLIDLKIKERAFLFEVNGFFVCRIGNGNNFLGIAPGGLEVIPGERPRADLSKIWGEGYDELRDFVRGAKETQKWAPLFLATSPSRSTDKTNILLIGPQGCGKTEYMRAIAAEGDSIAIFAVGSDFLTCWLGEAQKNPKRLFEEALRIRNSSKRHVHILIDEIDMVLNNDADMSRRVDLSLEFQNLMDGVVAYPGITIWGATNHPQRIPTPMLRRFARVMIVGEMTPEHRRLTLNHYLQEFLPCDPILADHYDGWAERLQGATGDVIRKVCDEVWLRSMRGYIADFPDHAKDTLASLPSSVSPAELSRESHATLRTRIGEKMQVGPQLVDDCMEHILGNFAVRQQIAVASQTYQAAHAILDTK